MDLAEIRKKAKKQGGNSRNSEAASAASPLPVTSAEIGAAGTPPAVADGGTQAAPPVADALDVLFSASSEVELATEENYLQTRQAGSEEMADHRQLLSFSLGREDYALDIESIREIIKPREVTDIPRVPEFVLGIISLRGIIIPIYDLKLRLRLGVTEITPASRIVVCQHEERVVGLLVDSISQVVSLSIDMIEPPPAVLSGLDRDMVEGVGRFQRKMMILLNLSCVTNAELV